MVFDGVIATTMGWGLLWDVPLVLSAIVVEWVFVVDGLPWTSAWKVERLVGLAGVRALKLFPPAKDADGES